MKKKPIVIAGLAVAAAALLAGCSSDADTVSHNLSQDAEQFKVERRVIFYNGITDQYMLTIEGRCSIEHGGGQLEVTCRVAEDEYKKHFLGLSDNVTYFVEQLETQDVSRYHYQVLFKPEAIVPELRVETGKQ